jgi:hypothetical protein
MNEELKINYSYSVSFLKAFSSQIFKRVQRPLSIVSVSGEFYKEQNRKEYKEAFEFLENLDQEMLRIENRLGDNGDVTVKLLDAQTDIDDADKRIEGIKAVLSDFESDVLAIVDKSVKAVNTLILVVSGILHGEPGARYDTLSNLNSVGGRNNRYLITSLERTVDFFSQGLDMLMELRDLESQEAV